MPPVLSTMVREQELEGGAEEVISEDFVLKNKLQDYVVLFWEKYIFLIESELGEFSIVSMKSLENNVLWGGIVSNKAFAILFENYVIKIESVESLFKNLGTNPGFGDQCGLSKHVLASSSENADIWAKCIDL